MSNKPFVKTLKTAYIGENNELIKEPLWEQVEDALSCFNKGKHEGFIEIADINDTKAMIIFGQNGAFHIGIVVEEEEFYYYWNGTQPSDKSVPIAGNFFKEHQICSDYITLVSLQSGLFTGSLCFFMWYPTLSIQL